MEKLLIIGGTKFIGRNLVNELIKSKRYDITLFNRGLTNPGLYPDLNKIVGDKDTDDIQRIGGTDWDYVIDLSSYFPDSLENTLKYIRPSLKRYIYISTVSVYEIQSYEDTFGDEHTAIKSCSQEDRTDRTNRTYGARKAACEEVIRQSNLSDYIILRPSVVYGEYDHTDRFYYWLYQARKKREILRPKNHDKISSYTYVKDLVNAMIQSLTIENHTQVYNTISHPAISIGQILGGAMKLLNTSPTIVDAPSEFLSKHKVNQFTDIPLWIDSNWHTFTNDKMLKDFDLNMIDFNKSLQDTIEYYHRTKWPQPTYGLSEDRKTEVIAALRKEVGV